MQVTEKYTIVLGPFAHGMYKEYILDNWHILERDVQQKTGIYVDAVIRMEEIICNGFSGCEENGNNCAMITCLRNPVICNNSNQYQTSLIMILRQLMNLQGIKYAAIDIQEVQFAFFPADRKKI